MKKLLFPFILFSPFYLSAQFIFQLGDIYEDAVRDIVLDNAGNVYITGTFQGSVDLDPGAGVEMLSSAGDPNLNENTDIFLASYHSSGELIWAISIGGTGPDVVYDLELDPSGGLYITGFFSGSMDVNPSQDEFILSAGTR